MGTVCDIGCGPGEIARYLRDLGADVIGIDLSEKMILEAETLNPDILFEQGNMLALDAQNHSFAGVAAFYAIVNLALDDVQTAINEFKRVIKNNGYLLLSFHSGNNESLRVERNVDGKNAAIDFIFFNADDILNILKDTGFEIVEAVIRYPYKDTEYQSTRAYILARNQS